MIGVFRKGPAYMTNSNFFTPKQSAFVKIS